MIPAYCTIFLLESAILSVKEAPQVSFGPSDGPFRQNLTTFLKQLEGLKSNQKAYRPSSSIFWKGPSDSPIGRCC